MARSGRGDQFVDYFESTYEGGKRKTFGVLRKGGSYFVTDFNGFEEPLRPDQDMLQEIRTVTHASDVRRKEGKP
jgi:hypothetical protein